MDATSHSLQLQARIDAIEARQRAYQQHDPVCPAFRAPTAADRLGILAVLPAPACTCWLKSQGEERA